MSREPSSEAGSTLIEALVAVSIVGISFSALVGGMFTTVKASDVNRKQASTATALASYAEAVKGDAYVPCPTASNYGAAYTAPAGLAKGPVTVAYWNATATAFQATCGTDSGLQRVTLSLRSTDGLVLLDVQVAKRSP